jgi:hypothetical protein
MSELLQPKDYMGQTITAGCTVVYPIRQGSNMWLQHMVVSHFDIIRSHVPVFKLHGTNSDGHQVKLDHADRCVIVKLGV